MKTLNKTYVPNPKKVFNIIKNIVLKTYNIVDFLKMFYGLQFIVKNIINAN